MGNFETAGGKTSGFASPAQGYEENENWTIYDALRQIIKNMPFSISIDNFIDAHKK